MNFFFNSVFSNSEDVGEEVIVSFPCMYQNAKMCTVVYSPCLLLILIEVHSSQ